MTQPVVQQVAEAVTVTVSANGAVGVFPQQSAAVDVSPGATQVVAVIPQPAVEVGVSTGSGSGGGSDSPDIFIQDTDPGDPGKDALWVKTGLGPGGAGFDLLMWNAP